MVSRLFSSKAIKPLTLYLDTLSQPCRALEIFLKSNRIAYTPETVNLGKMEHLTEDFAKLNPFKKVPVIDDNGFTLTESVAIFRYICKTAEVADNWYPHDSAKQAYVDEFLEWQHIGLRAPCGLYVWAVFFTPNITGEPVHPKVVETRRKAMMQACDDMNNIWLRNNKSFITGPEICFADVLAACELQQLVLTDYDPKIGRPVLASWLERVRTATNPYFDEAHAKILKVAARKSKTSKL